MVTLLGGDFMVKQGERQESLRIEMIHTRT